jgi:DNA-binding NarL/FixJ family response regulator
MDCRVTVFLAAGNRLLREALVRILNKKSDLAVVGAVPFSPAVLPQVVAANCDVLLMDSAAAEEDGLQFIHDVQQQSPQTHTLLIGMEEQEDLFLATVRAGVRGYVLKEAPAADVVAAVRAVANEEAVCSPRLCLSLFRLAARQAAPMVTLRLTSQMGLTRRERQVLPLIARGLTNKEIASSLSLSEQTVKNHVYRIMQKAGAGSRVEIMERCQAANQFL